MQKTTSGIIIKKPRMRRSSNRVVAQPTHSNSLFSVVAHRRLPWLFSLVCVSNPYVTVDWSCDSHLTQYRQNTVYQKALSSTQSPQIAPDLLMTLVYTLGGIIYGRKENRWTKKKIKDYKKGESQYPLSPSAMTLC